MANSGVRGVSGGGGGGGFLGYRSPPFWSFRHPPPPPPRRKYHGYRYHLTAWWYVAVNTQHLLPCDHVWRHVSSAASFSTICFSYFLTTLIRYKQAMTISKLLAKIQQATYLQHVVSEQVTAVKRCAWSQVTTGLVIRFRILHSFVA